MIVMKFGGTSMGSAERILSCAKIILMRAREDRVATVASAVAGVSNMLEESIAECTTDGEKIGEFTDRFEKIHTRIIQDLARRMQGDEEANKEFDSSASLSTLHSYVKEYTSLLTALSTMGECPLQLHCKIMGLGEQVSTSILQKILQSKAQVKVELVDSRECVITSGEHDQGEADYEESAKRTARYREGNSILIFPGFISGWRSPTGKIKAGLLGRNGSDFSASIIAASLGAARVEFWSDVDGVYTADPRVVKDAILLKNISYDEAIELAFFGSKVLHPKTLLPLKERGISAVCLNTMNPTAPGTLISEKPHDYGEISGISCLKGVAMISVSGSLMRDKHGMAGRIFQAVNRARASVILITQSSSEYTISFCVRQKEVSSVVSELKKEFVFERQNKLMDEVSVKEELSVVSVVGERMVMNRGVAAKFLSALSSRNINIISIAQGANERCISSVISQCASEEAVRTIHRFFFSPLRAIDLFIFGTGAIGGTLLDQIAREKESLLAQNIEMKLKALASAVSFASDVEGLSLEDWRKEEEKAPPCTEAVDKCIEMVKSHRLFNPVFVDCTASDELACRYTELLEAGFNVVAANKKANAASLSYYNAIREASKRNYRKFLYETNVGAGLPIIDTLKNLFRSGDKLVEFTGIMSGSLSYIFGRLGEGVAFSQAVREAKEKNFTEPDAREDLSGADVARKALIIAREAGMEMEMSDIEMESIFPLGFDLSGSAEEFMTRLPDVDGYFSSLSLQAKEKGEVLRMGAVIKDGKAQVKMFSVKNDDVLATVKGGENAFVFLTERYNPIPLTVRGYGAGREVTAAGVFSDILRTVKV